jgi:hypothetical protein
MPLIIISEPVNFTHSGNGTLATPYIIESTNHADSSTAEIAFLATENGIIFPNLIVSSELNYDFGILINNESYVAISGSGSFTTEFSVNVGDQVKVQFAKNNLNSSGTDNITGTILFDPTPKYMYPSTLFISGGYNQNIGLFVQNDSAEKITDLFLKSLNFKSLDLTTQSNIDNGLSLTTIGSGRRPIAKSFYLNGKFQNNIFLSTKSEVENKLNFYTTSAEFANTQLYLNLKSQSENSIPLFINNIPTPSLNNYLDLNIHSSTNDSIFNGLDLYILALEKSAFDLFVLVDTIGINNESVNLQIIGDILFENSKEQINLFLQNSYLSEYGEMPITIVGFGTLFDSTPYGESINLYIERQMDGFWDNIAMVTVGNLSDYSNVEFITYGKNSSEETFNLNMPETKELVTNETHLYVHGYIGE